MESKLVVNKGKRKMEKMTIAQAEKMVCDHYGISEVRDLRMMCVTEEAYMDVECEVVETLASEGFTYKEAQKLWNTWF